MDNPNEDSIYLCGNSLGLQAKKSREYIDRELDKWAKVYVKEELKDFTFLKNFSKLVLWHLRVEFLELSLLVNIY